MSSKEITDESVGLKKLVDHISQLSPQSPAEFRSEPQKIRFLRNAIVDLDWAHQPLSQCTSAKYTYNSFVTALREALQLHMEKQRRSGRSPGTFTVDYDDDFPQLLYDQYGQHPKRVNGRFNQSRHSPQARTPQFLLGRIEWAKMENDDLLWLWLGHSSAEQQ
eukprot:IDg598t1